MMTFKINPEKIRDVIGKGGAVIRALTEETGTTIDIEDDGTVTIASVNADACNVARKRIEDITADVEVGRIYEGTVLRLLDFGAIVQVLPGKDGLLHISQIAKERVNQVSDYVKEGQIVRVKVLEADDKGRLRLSMKAAAEDAAAPAPRAAQPAPTEPTPSRQRGSSATASARSRSRPTGCGARRRSAREHFRISTETMPWALIRRPADWSSARRRGSMPRAGRAAGGDRRAIVAAADEALAGRHGGEFPLAVWQTGSGT